MTKKEARQWLKRARLDLREFEAILSRPGAGWLEDPAAYELLNDAIGSAAAIQTAQEDQQ